MDAYCTLKIAEGKAKIYQRWSIDEIRGCINIKGVDKDLRVVLNILRQVVMDYPVE
jgi:hypothetical protein